MTADVQIGQKFGALSHIWGSPPRSPFSTILPPQQKSRKFEDGKMVSDIEIGQFGALSKIW